MPWRPDHVDEGGGTRASILTTDISEELGANGQATLKNDIGMSVAPRRISPAIEYARFLLPSVRGSSNLK